MLVDVRGIEQKLKGSFRCPCMISFVSLPYKLIIRPDNEVYIWIRLPGFTGSRFQCGYMLWRIVPRKQDDYRKPSSASWLQNAAATRQRVRPKNRSNGESLERLDRIDSHRNRREHHPPHSLSDRLADALCLDGIQPNWGVLAMPLEGAPRNKGNIALFPNQSDLLRTQLGIPAPKKGFGIFGILQRSHILKLRLGLEPFKRGQKITVKTAKILIRE